MLKNVIYYGPVCATGDGHLMAQEIGVPLFNMDKVATKHFGVETTPGQGIHIHWAVAALFTKTGAIAVNKAGERVVDESGDELDIALASMHKSSDGRLYIVMDQEDYTLFSDILMQYGAFTQEQLDAFIQENGSGVTKLVKNDTLAGAAEAIGLDAAAVEATVAAYNQDATAGKADPFGPPLRRRDRGRPLLHHADRGALRHDAGRRQRHRQSGSARCERTAGARPVCGR